MPEEREYSQFLEDVLAKLVPERTYQLDVKIESRGRIRGAELSWRRTHTITDVTSDAPIPLDQLVDSGEGGYDSESEMRTDETESRDSFYKRIAEYAERQFVEAVRVSPDLVRYSKRAWQAEECEHDLLKATADAYGLSPEDAPEFIPDNE
mgnify:CR=1 FL=1